MGIFGKRKNVADEQEKVVDVKELILENLNEKMKGTLYDGCIIMPRHGFSVDVQVSKNETDENGFHLINVIFMLNHDDLDEPMFEPVFGHSETLEKAVEMAVESFRCGFWHSLDLACTRTGGVPVSADFLGYRYDFNMYVQSVVVMGSQAREATPLISFIKDDIKNYLGSKKYYWVAILLTRVGDKANIEVRVNGAICQELCEKFRDYVASWETTGGVMIEKQHVIFVQEEDDKCPWKKATAVEASKKCIELMEECKSPEDYAEIKKTLSEMTGDENLAMEIRMFIPEILARLVMRFKEGDSLFLIGDDGNTKTEFKKTQLRSYYYIQKVIMEYLQIQQPTQETVMRIVANSVAFNEMRRAFQGQDDVDLTRVYVPGMNYKASVENYRIW